METKIYDIRERTFQFSVQIVNLYRTLDKRSIDNQVLGKQLLRSGTSVGALCQEAHSGESTPDFIHKYAISLKESRETLYWLRLLVATGILDQKRVDHLLKENDEIIRILVTIIVRLKAKVKKS